MMLLKLILLVVLGAIFYQDVRERLVYWFLFPLAGLVFGMIHFMKVGSAMFLIHIIFNVVLVSCILAVLWSYSAWRFKQKKFSQVFGLGDVLMMYALTFSFAPYSFVIVLVFGLMFSLLIQEVFNTTRKSLHYTTHDNSAEILIKNTVPLAGYIALFFGLIILLNSFFNFFNLYTI